MDEEKIRNQPLTACKQYCLAAGATEGNIAYTQNVSTNFKNDNNNETFNFNLDNFNQFLLLQGNRTMYCKRWT
jgi:hypothetical protein